MPGRARCWIEGELHAGASLLALRRIGRGAVAGAGVALARSWSGDGLWSAPGAGHVKISPAFPLLDTIHVYFSPVLADCGSRPAYRFQSSADHGRHRSAAGHTATGSGAQ